jgi:hypothetical protein
VIVLSNNIMYVNFSPVLILAFCGRIKETTAALQVGMPPAKNIEHLSLAMHYTKVNYTL